MSTRRSVADALAWFADARRQAQRPRSARSPSAILKEINERLGFLNNVGLDYLNLDRTSRHAVGRREPAHPPRQPDRLRPVGRALRARRALDRPPPARQRPAARDAASACATSATPCSSSSMTRMRSAPPIMSSTWGPGAGVHGGEVVAAGHARRRARATRTASPPIISPAAARSRSPPRRRKGNGKKLTVHGATRQQSARTSPPRSRSAPSPASPASRGSGKSSFTIDTLYAAAARR